jgi:hypothetical protein
MGRRYWIHAVSTRKAAELERAHFEVIELAHT